MRKYDSYKDSGIEWIGEIPSHWEVRRLKYVSSINDDTLSDRTDGGFEIEYVDISSIESGVGITKSEKFSFKEAPSRARRLVKDGDIIVSTVRTYLRAIARIEYPKPNLVVSTGFAVVRPRDVIPEYAGHLFYHENLLGEIVSRSVGVSYPAINSSEIGTIKIPLPNPKEQTAIASYLDRKTAEIDELIADKKCLLELFEEEKTAIINELVTGKKVWNGNTWTEPVEVKDSGIEWLGEIPEHWEIRRIKSISSHFKGYAFKSSDFELNDGIPIVKASNIKKWQIVDITSFISESNQRPEFENVILKKGDVILSTVGSKPDVVNSAVGQLATVDAEFDNSYLNQNTLCIRPNEQVNDLFLKYTFLSKYFRANLDSISAWIANQAYLEVEDILTIQVILPLIEEQKDISTFLDAECTRIDSKKAKTKKLIELLTEYRTALISEVVTGKIKVIE